MDYVGLVLIGFFFEAIVTCKGVVADAGHYIGFVKKCVFHVSKWCCGWGGW